MDKSAKSIGREKGVMRRFLRCIFRLLFGYVLGLAVAGSGLYAAEWTQQLSGTGEDLNGIWGASSSNVYAVGDNATLVRFDGDSWSPVTTNLEADYPSGLSFTAISGRSANNVFIVGTSGWAMQFDGAAWTRIDPGTTSSFRSVWTSAASSLVYFFTANRGYSYDDQSKTITPLAFSECSFCTPAFTALAVFENATAYRDTAGFYRLINPSSTPREGFYVNRKRFGITSSMHGSWAISEADIYVVGDGIFRCNNGNPRNISCWKQINRNGHYRSVWALDSNNVYATGAGNLGSLISYFDGNADNTWVEQYSTFDGSMLTGIYGFSANDVFAVGEAGVVLRLGDGSDFRTAANFPASANANGFVNAHTGELLIDHVDVDLGGPIPLVFVRRYISRLFESGVVNAGLGTNWTHNYNWQLTADNESGTDVVTIVSDQGRILRFENDPGDGWVQASAFESSLRLEESATEFVLIDLSSEQLMHFSKALGRLASIRDRNGNRLSLVYPPNDFKLRQISNSAGAINIQYDGQRISSLSYNGFTAGALQSREVLYRYDTDNNLLAGVTDQEINETLYAYNQAMPASALLTKITRPEGNIPYQWVYDDQNRVARQIMADADNTEQTFVYSGGTTTVTLEGGPTTVFIHDADGRLTSVKEGTSNPLAFSYDNNGRLHTMTDRDGDAVEYSWHDPSGKPETRTETSAGLGTIVHTYEARTGADGREYYDQTMLALPDGIGYSFVYDNKGNRQSATRASGPTTSFEFNDMGLVTRVQTPDLGDYRYKYSSAGNRTSTSETGAAVEIKDVYDGFGNRVSRFFNGSSKIKTFIFDKRNLLLSATDEDEHSFEFFYDGNARLTEYRAPNGQIIKYQYDDLDRMTQSKDMDGGMPLGIEYSPEGLIERITGTPDAESIGFSFNDSGFLTELAINSSETWRFQHSQEGNLTGITAPLGRRMSMTLHPDAAPASIVLAGDTTSNTVRFGKASNNRVNSITVDNSDFSATAGFDTDNRINGVQLANGSTTGVTRKDNGLINQVTDSANHNWQFLSNGAYQITSVIDPLERTTNLAYDTITGRLGKVIFPESMGAMRLERDGRGNVIRLQFLDSRSVLQETLEYAYNEVGYLVSGTGFVTTRDTTGNITNSNGIINGYDDRGRLTQIDFGDRRIITYHYDGFGRVVKIDDWLGETALVLDYDEEGRLTGIARDNGIHSGFGYGDLGRLDAVTHGPSGADPLASISAEYGEDGLILKTKNNSPLAAGIAADQDTVFSYDAAYQITLNSHDGLGRVTSDAKHDYTWSLSGQLVRVDRNTGTETYQYDALGRRVGDKLTDYSWNYAIDGSAMQVATDKGVGAEPEYYIYLPNGRLLYRVIDGRRQFYHFGLSGNTILLTNDDGDLLNAYRYSPYGTLLAQRRVVANSMVWRGQWGVQSDPTGLYYMTTRYFDPGSFRFISRISALPLNPAESSPYSHPARPTAESLREGMVAVSASPIHTKRQTNSREEGFLRALTAAIGANLTLLSKAVPESLAPNASGVGAFFSPPKRAVGKSLLFDLVGFNPTGTSRAARVGGVGFQAINFVFSAYSEKADAYTTNTPLKLTGKALVGGNDLLYDRIGLATASELLDAGAQMLGLPRPGLIELPRNASRTLVAVVDDFIAFVRGDARAGEASQGLVREMRNDSGAVSGILSSAEDLLGSALYYGLYRPFDIKERYRENRIQRELDKVMKRRKALTDPLKFRTVGPQMIPGG